MNRLLLIIFILLQSMVVSAYELTYEDSLELKLIEQEHPSASQHLYLYIHDLQNENERLKAELDETQIEPSEDNTNLILIVSLLTLASGVGAFLFYKKRQKDKAEIIKFQELADRAQDTLEQREKFLAYTNHEIRTPLNAVSGSAELLMGTELSEAQDKYVKTIKASVDNVLVLVNDVLDLSRIESGNFEFQHVDFLLSDVITGIAYILQEKVDKKGIQLYTEIDPKIPAVIKGDSRYLNQILINLCNNAVKFTDLGKVVLKAKLLGEEGNDLHIRFDIEDTGKGIRKSKLSTIFDQFEQETRHTIKHKGGSGLGLAITKQLVELQGGNISVDSKYLEGTCFSVELKFSKGTEQKINKENVDASVLDDMRLLVVDDNELNREILKDLLNKLNPSSQIDLVEDGEKAIDKLKQHDYDCVLMDIQMPGMDGYETTQYIRKNMRRPMNEVSVIAMTAYAMDDVAAKCFESGMNDFITKPLSSQFLLRKIQRLKEKKAQKKTTDLHFEYIDLGNLKRLTRGDTNKMYKYIDLFLQNVPNDMSVLKSHISEGDLSSALQILHKIKGNTVYMGNTEVGDIHDSLLEDNHGLDVETELNRALEISEKCVKEIQEVKKNYKLLFLGINK